MNFIKLMTCAFATTVVAFGLLPVSVEAQSGASIEITNSSVMANQAMTISYSFPQSISAIQYYVTGPSPAGSQNSPGTVAANTQSGQISVTPQDITGNPNMLPGSYRLYVRSVGSSVGNYLSESFTVLPSAGGGSTLPPSNTPGMISPPSNVTTLPGGCNSNAITVVWDPVPGALSYNVQYYIGSSQVPRSLGQTNSRGIIHTNAQPGETYRYRVQARSSQITTAYSEPLVSGVGPALCGSGQLPGAAQPIPAPGANPQVGYKSDRALAYAISFIQYVQKLVAYEWKPIGNAPQAPAPIQL